MYAMQYEIKLPNDYDMDIIRNRVKMNGFKTDKFPGLSLKAYLIKEKDHNNITNIYAPFYLWNDSEGMNKFIFDGYYDNIISSFGWQKISIGIKYEGKIEKNIKKSRYLVEEYIDIQPVSSIKKLDIKSSFECYENTLSEVIIYNPEKWKVVKFSFVENLPNKLNEHVSYYEILHISN